MTTKNDNHHAKNNTNMKPKAETVAFLLQYSKSLTVIKSEDFIFEINSN